MKEIKNIGNMPKPLVKFGMLDEEANKKLEFALKGQPEEVKNFMRAQVKVFECRSLTELSVHASLDDCADGIIIDTSNNRYYLVGLTIDPGRIRMKIEDTEFTDNDVVEDYTIKPARVMYYMEVTYSDYLEWRKEDLNARQKWWDEKKAKEKLAMDKAIAKAALMEK